MHVLRDPRPMPGGWVSEREREPLAAWVVWTRDDLAWQSPTEIRASCAGHPRIPAFVTHRNSHSAVQSVKEFRRSSH